MQNWFGMPQPISPGSATGAGECLNDAAAPATDAAASPELPLERSRFSRWLASFGLGESTIPLLRPLKSPRQPGGR